ncbi:MAG: hypothetical protein ACYDBZ_11465 [Steroidobacteraceae bacterium]
MCKSVISVARPWIMSCLVASWPAFASAQFELSSEQAAPEMAGLTAGGFFIPGLATPGTSTGKLGLLVVPSNAPTTAPAFVSKNQVHVLGVTLQITLTSAGMLQSYSPYAVVYLDKGTDGFYHVYSLALNNTGSLPKPVQVGSLKLAATADLCSEREAQTNLLQPTTLFLLVQTAGTNGVCGDADDVYEVVHFTDSATTAPKVVAVHTTRFSTIYTTTGKTPGPLGGIVMLDTPTGHLDFYTSNAFTSPKSLLSGITSYRDLFTNFEYQFTGNNADFFAVTANSGIESVYRVTTTGTITDEYTAKGTIGGDTSDASAVYFTDTVAAKHSETFWEEPLAGGTPLELFATTESADQSDSLVGSNGSLLVFSTSHSATSSATLNTLPVGKKSTTVHTIATFSGYLTADMLSPTNVFGGADSIIFANVSKFGTTGIAYSSEAIKPSGSVVKALLPKSHFFGRVTPTSGAIFQAQGITDTNGGYGGAKVYSVNMTSGAATAYNVVGGGNFVVPTAYVLDSLSPLSTSGVGAGNESPLVGGNTARD